MEKIKIHIFHTGSVCVSPYLPFGGDNCNIIKASGLFGKKSERLWLPVSAYFVEHPQGKFLIDCGWGRDMSPHGKYDQKAQIKALGSRLLYKINQGKVEIGAAVAEQLSAMGIKPEDLDYVLCTHLDCDHVSGLQSVKNAKKILVAAEEMACANKHRFVRYKSKWWNDVNITEFAWNTEYGPFGKAYDLFGDGSVLLVNIPGHSDGLFAVKIRNEDGKYVLLVSDGGYAEKSWQKMIRSGLYMDKEKQRRSLGWIHDESLNENCIKVLANHDPNVVPHTIVL